MDSNLASNDKILALIEEKPEAVAFRAAFSYTCSIGYANGHDTDGLIKFATLKAVHGTKRSAELLVMHHLWTPDPEGWRIVNFTKRNPSAATTQQVRNAQRAGALKANCARWHGKDCKCWEEVA